MANEPLNQKVETKAEPQVQKPVEQPKVEQQPEVKVDEDEAFINSLLEEVDTEEQSNKLTPEEQLLKNKNAELARKRRAAELAVAQGTKPVEEKVEGSTIQQPTPQTTQEEAKKPEEKVQEAPKEEPKVEQPQQVDVNALGKQLVEFKSKYPDIDLAQLDNDKAFKKFIDGKLLGKKDFIKLYEEYVELKAEITGSEVQVVRNNYQKSQSSSGKATGSVDVSSEVFSEEELRRVASRLPFMSTKEAAKIEAKLKKSIAYYESKK